MANKLYDEASVQAIANAIRSKNKTETKYKISQMAQAIEDIPSIIKRKTGNPIELSDGADAPLVKCTTTIQGYQEGTGTPSPTNVRPIHAYNQSTISVGGVNLWDEDVRNGYYNSTTGAFVSYSNCIANVNPIRVTPNTQYYSVSGSYTLIGYFYDANMGFITQTQINTGRFTTPNNCHYLNICNSYGQGGTYNNDISINYPSTFTTYEPYTSTTHTTTYPSAIYRGSEDCVKGKVTTEWAVIESYAGETLPGEWISDRDEYAPGTTPTTGAQVAYALATPSTASVTPSNLPIKSLSGYNHIESSTGDMEVDYITDAYQEFVDTTNRALPSTRKGGDVSAMDIFLSLDTLEETTSSEDIETKEDDGSEDKSENIEEITR